MTNTFKILSPLFGALCFGLVACGSEPETVTADEPVAVETAPVQEAIETAPVEAEAETVEANAPVANNKTFGITLEQFGKNLSSEAKEAGMGDIPVGKFDVREGAVNDGFTEILTDAIAMNGTVDKNGELKAITFIMGQTQEGEKEVMTMTLMAGLVARALSPNLPEGQTAGKVVKLLGQSVQDYSEKGEGENSEVVDNVKYTVTANKTTGLWIVFEPA